MTALSRGEGGGLNPPSPVEAETAAEDCLRWWLCWWWEMLGEVNSLPGSIGEASGDIRPSEKGNPRGLWIRSGDEGWPILEGDSCLRGDDAPGRMRLRRWCCLELACLLRSPNSEIGESVRGGGREATEEDLILPSLSPASLSKMSDSRRDWLCPVRLPGTPR
jgi:hypothetical protein